ncbi:MAG TPA: iron-containing redox enzyme family protein, partial [Solirubrobacterales bacterium]|nr:iron-containing redox enzyme family protein [Solirubrobacterales bacterium]
MGVLEGRQDRLNESGGTTASGAPLPSPVGPLSAFVADCLVRPAGDAGAGDGDLRTVLEDAERDLAEVDHNLAEDDLQLALYLCYELHYSSFCDVDAGWEWDPLLIRLRRVLESAFLTALQRDVPKRDATPAGLGERLFRIAAEEDGPSLSGFLEREGVLDHFREFAVQRSAYQLKEADPHTWAIPRIAGPPKAALVEVQADEYGGGRPDRMHSALFAKTMRALGLDDRPGSYLDRLPGITLAGVNLISMFGLIRAHRGALVGHLAMFEMTSAIPNRRYA